VAAIITVFRSRAGKSRGAFGDLVRGVERCLPDRRNASEIASMLWASLHGLVSLRDTMPHFPFPAVKRSVALMLDAYLGPTTEIDRPQE
jgi:hypothetical protein